MKITILNGKTASGGTICKAALMLALSIAGFASASHAQSLAPEHFERVLTNRMAAWNYAIVRTYEQAPVSRLYSYVRENYGIQYTALARIVPQVEIDGKLYSPAEATDIKVDDFPGGVFAQFTLGGVKVETRITSLLIGSGETTRVGAAVYSVKTEPAATVKLLVGESFWQRSSFEDMSKVPFQPLDAKDNKVEKSGDTYIITTAEHSAMTGVKGSGEITVRTDDKGGQFLECTFDKGSGDVMLGFTEDKNQLLKLMRTDEKKALKDVEKHYGELLSNRIETPDKLIDQAFASALQTLEYSWVAPLGWVECIHHWTSLWHMQQTVAAEWIGQTDRSRMSTVTQGEMVNSDGSIPHLAPFGFSRRDFGGTNQFWAWQVRHYWNFTGDKAFIEETAPVLDKVIAQTFGEYDKNDNLLLGWGLQIGNQEDYVATAGDGTTPSIEGINMMRTRAELAEGMGDAAVAARWHALADEAAARLRKELWIPDLGRFKYFDDDLGQPRLDGQYHTYTYPAIFDITDLPDSYTNLRHLNDRLTDEEGAVYCSNNFPFHAVGTWGMQAGAAQQPWATWALAAAGLRNLTPRPLHALASWVMDGNHRGSWPEVSTEATPAYFSPPAGIYVASIAEGLFGLHMHVPEGYIAVSPNFPDDWPSASMHLKNHSVEFKRSGNTLEYNLHTEMKLARRIKWSLPLCKNVHLENNGKSIPVKLSPGINGVFAEAELPAENDSRIRITYNPIEFSVDAPGSVAEGERMSITLKGAELMAVEDRAGIFGSAAVSGNNVDAKVKTGLLAPYLRFGNLGNLNFSRRTVFLKAKTDAGALFYIPVDFTVLPRYEAYTDGELRISGDKLTVDLVLRNNTEEALSGQASLNISGEIFPVTANVAPRSEKKQSVAFDGEDLSLFSPGTNNVKVILPGREVVNVRIIMGDMMAAGTLSKFAKANLRPVMIEPLLKTPDKEWQRVRKYEAFYHPPWNACPPPLESVTEGAFDIPQIPGLSFRIEGRNFATVSRSNRTPVVTIDGKGLNCKKLYFLFIPLLDNADMFSQVARITVRDADGGTVSRVFNFPGDFDWSCPPSAVGRFATAMENRPLLQKPLALMAAGEADHRESIPPKFPQPEHWSNSAAVVTQSGVFTVIEFDLERTRELEWIEVEAMNAISALGLVAVTGYFADDMEPLAGTPWNPPAFRMPPVTLFDIIDDSSLSGWEFEGNAFSIAHAPGLFTTPTLNSLMRSGETAKGRALSPVFQLPEWCSQLDFETQGGTAMKDKDGNETLCIRLLDADSGKELTVMLVAGVHYLTHRFMDVSAFHGKNLRIELVDQNERTSYAWIGVKKVSFRP